MSLISKYKKRVQIHHGWEVELQCPKCGNESVPKLEDGLIDTKKVHNNPADTPMLCANVTCPECGHDLKEQAGKKLTELFNDVPKKFGMPSVVMGILLFLPFPVLGIQMIGRFAGWWGDWGFWQFAALAICGAVFVIGHYIVQPLMYSCECGAPKFLLMGVVGRSYCFRCSSCSRLLRRGR